MGVWVRRKITKPRSCSVLPAVARSAHHDSAEKCVAVRCWDCLLCEQQTPCFSEPMQLLIGLLRKASKTLRFSLLPPLIKRLIIV